MDTRRPRLVGDHDPFRALRRRGQTFRGRQSCMIRWAMRCVSPTQIYDEPGRCSVVDVMKQSIQRPRHSREHARAGRMIGTAPRAVPYGRTGTCTQEFGTLTNVLQDFVNIVTGNLQREGGWV